MKSNLYKDWLGVLNLFPKKDKLKLVAVSVIQFGLAILDLLGIAIIGVIGALSVYGLQSKTPGERISKILEIFSLENQSFQNQIAILSSVAAIFLISKTIISAYLLRITISYTSNQGALISKILFEKIIKNKLHVISKLTHQELIYASTASIDQLTIGVIGSSVAIFSDFGVLSLMFIGLLYFDPFISVSSLSLFIFIFFITNRIISKTVIQTGKSGYHFKVLTNEILDEYFNTYRENFVRNQERRYVELFLKLRRKSASVNATELFFPYIPKFLIEITLILGGILIAGIQLRFSDVAHAVGVLSVFLAAATRIAPSVMRIQQSFTHLKYSMTNSKKALEILTIPDLNPVGINEIRSESHVEEFNSIIEISNLKFEHSDSMFSIEINNLFIKSFSQISIVGPSGSGKTTFVDLILGIHSPKQGKILLSGMKAELLHLTWPNAIAYVPQEVKIVNGTIKHNILLGINENEIEVSKIWDVLEQVKLSEFVEGLPNKLESQVGDSGSRLSGGQRQRLGIARALISNPKLIVLDEATSALDSETEYAIAQSLKEIRSKTSLIIIAHRLSTVIDSDLILYMNSGKIEASGTFQELIKRVPNFQTQAKLMGLSK